MESNFAGNLAVLLFHARLLVGLAPDHGFCLPAGLAPCQSDAIAYTARFVRTSMLEVLAQPYITTALAFGIDRKKVVFKYAFKNALLPLVTLVGIYLPFLLSGAVITESIFAWPGMGRLTVNAIFAYDYPVILAATLVAAIAVVVGNLVSDLLYCVVDPRIRQTRV
jgi:peptide/nickel transport system permease protein